MADVWRTALVECIRAFVFVYDIFAFIPSYLIYSPKARLRKSKRIKAYPITFENDSTVTYSKASPAVDDIGPPYRSVDVPGDLSTSLYSDCLTLDDLFLRSVCHFSSHNCLGTRELLSEEDEVQPNGRIFKKFIFGDYHWLSFEEVYNRCSNFGSGLLALGQKPKENILIFSETKAEWMIAAQACFKYNFPVVTLYATLGQDAIVHGINESDVSFVLVSGDLLPKLKEIIGKIPKVTNIIYMNNGKRINTDDFTNRLKILSMDEVESIGSKPENLMSPVTKPVRGDIALIMYTSGSTGLPKGVMITHGNLMSGMSGQSERIPNLGSHDIYIGFLPLAHVLELSAETACLGNGASIGYSSPLTLTDKSNKIKRGSKGDITVLRPTLVASVPVILDRIYKGVWDQVSRRGPTFKLVFKFAYDYKKKWLTRGYDTPIINKFIFSKICTLLGGRVRGILSGGAPLSETTQIFMNICFCCPVGQGYGLTETCGAGTVMEESDLELGRVGAPLICNDIRLRDWPEGSYTNHDKPYPRGEILIGGGNVSKGYYKNQKKTDEDFIMIDGIRHFCTGDIGQFEDDGCLRVIDRKKDLVKLQAGEYVSLGKVETALKMCPLIEQICIYADSNQNYTIAFAVPNEKNMRNLAQDLGVGDKEYYDICKDTKVVNETLKQLNALGLKSKIEKFELPMKLMLCPEPWLPETGLVTDSMKMKRKSFHEHYINEIRQMYS